MDNSSEIDILEICKVYNWDKSLSANEIMIERLQKIKNLFGEILHFISANSINEKDSSVDHSVHSTCRTGLFSNKAKKRSYE